MNLKRCENGHFFDGDKFPSCPHCAAVGGGQQQATMSYGDTGNGYGPAMTENVTVPMYGQEPQAAPGGFPMQPQMAEPQAGTISLQDAVSRAITAPAPMQQDDEKTVSLYQYKNHADPVAGWLVCIEGADFGSSFTVKSGRNFIGRASHMDIVLRGDNSISREKHASIRYEPKSREFIALAGESREVF